MPVLEAFAKSKTLGVYLSVAGVALVSCACKGVRYLLFAKLSEREQDHMVHTLQYFVIDVVILMSGFYEHFTVGKACVSIAIVSIKSYCLVASRRVMDLTVVAAEQNAGHDEGNDAANAQQGPRRGALFLRPLGSIVSIAVVIAGRYFVPVRSLGTASESKCLTSSASWNSSFVHCKSFASLFVRSFSWLKRDVGRAFWWKPLVNKGLALADAGWRFVIWSLWVFGFKQSMGRGIYVASLCMRAFWSVVGHVVDCAVLLVSLWAQVRLKRHNARSVERMGIAQDPCAFCYESFRAEKCVELACGHIFHESCFQEWVIEQPRCPTCKRSPYWGKRIVNLGTQQQQTQTQTQRPPEQQSPEAGTEPAEAGGTSAVTGVPVSSTPDRGGNEELPRRAEATPVAPGLSVSATPQQASGDHGLPDTPSPGVGSVPVSMNVTGRTEEGSSVSPPTGVATSYYPAAVVVHNSDDFGEGDDQDVDDQDGDGDISAELMAAIHMSSSRLDQESWMTASTAAVERSMNSETEGVLDVSRTGVPAVALAEGATTPTPTFDGGVPRRFSHHATTSVEEGACEVESVADSKSGDYVDLLSVVEQVAPVVRELDAGVGVAGDGSVVSGGDVELVPPPSQASGGMTMRAFQSHEVPHDSCEGRPGGEQDSQEYIQVAEDGREVCRNPTTGRFVSPLGTKRRSQSIDAVNES